MDVNLAMDPATKSKGDNSGSSSKEAALSKVVDQWNHRLSRRLLTYSIGINGYAFENVLKNYIQTLKGRVLKGKKSLRDKILAHVKFFHTLHEEKCIDIEESIYLQYMEQIMLIYCNLEVQVLRLTKLSSSDAIRECANTLWFHIQYYCLRNQKSVFYVLLNLNIDSLKTSIRKVLQLIYNHALVYFPIEEHTVDVLYRYYLGFKLLKQLSPAQSYTAIDGITCIRLKKLMDQFSTDTLYQKICSATDLKASIKLYFETQTLDPARIVCIDDDSDSDVEIINDGLASPIPVPDDSPPNTKGSVLITTIVTPHSSPPQIRAVIPENDDTVSSMAPDSIVLLENETTTNIAGSRMEIEVVNGPDKESDSVIPNTSESVAGQSDQNVDSPKKTREPVTPIIVEGSLRTEPEDTFNSIPPQDNVTNALETMLSTRSNSLPSPIIPIIVSSRTESLSENIDTSSPTHFEKTMQTEVENLDWNLQNGDETHAELQNGIHGLENGTEVIFSMSASHTTEVTNNAHLQRCPNECAVIMGLMETSCECPEHGKVRQASGGKNGTDSARLKEKRRGLRVRNLRGALRTRNSGSTTTTESSSPKSITSDYDSSVSDNNIVLNGELRPPDKEMVVLSGVTNGIDLYRMRKVSVRVENIFKNGVYVSNLASSSKKTTSESEQSYATHNSVVSTSSNGSVSNEEEVQRVSDLNNRRKLFSDAIIVNSEHTVMANDDHEHQSLDPDILAQNLFRQIRTPASVGNGTVARSRHRGLKRKEKAEVWSEPNEEAERPNLCWDNSIRKRVPPEPSSKIIKWVTHSNPPSFKIDLLLGEAKASAKSAPDAAKHYQTDDDKQDYSTSQLIENVKSATVANYVVHEPLQYSQVDILNLTLSKKSEVDPEFEFSNSPKFLQGSEDIVEHCLQDTSSLERLAAPPSEEPDTANNLLSNNSNFYNNTDSCTSQVANSDGTNSDLDDSSNKSLLPFKKRKIPVLMNKGSGKVVNNNMKEEISYPATPMMSIAELEVLQLQENRRSKPFKTLAERKEMPPTPTYYSFPATEPSPPAVDHQFNVNNHSLNFQMNNVMPFQFINMPCYSVDNSYFSSFDNCNSFNNSVGAQGVQPAAGTAQRMSRRTPRATKEPASKQSRTTT